MLLKDTKKEFDRAHPDYKRLFTKTMRSAMGIKVMTSAGPVQSFYEAAQIAAKARLRRKLLERAQDILLKMQTRCQPHKIDELAELIKLCTRQADLGEELMLAFLEKPEETHVNLPKMQKER